LHPSWRRLFLECGTLSHSTNLPTLQNHRFPLLATETSQIKLVEASSYYTNWLVCNIVSHNDNKQCDQSRLRLRLRLRLPAGRKDRSQLTMFFFPAFITFAS